MMRRGHFRLRVLTNNFFDDLKKYMWVKNEGMQGPDQSKGDVREVVCLNRIFRWCEATGHRKDAIDVEADARHAEIIAAQLQLKVDSGHASYQRRRGRAARGQRG